METRSRRFLTPRRAWLAALVVAAAGLGAAGMAMAAGPGWSSHPGFGLLGGRGPGGPHGMSDDDIRFVVGWTLHKVNATDDQVSRITAIALSAHADMAAQAQTRRAQHDAFTAAFVADDKPTLEKLRVQQVTNMTAASQRYLAALEDAADVLTQDQRQALADLHAHHQTPSSSSSSGSSSGS